MYIKPKTVLQNKRHILLKQRSQGIKNKPIHEISFNFQIINQIILQLRINHPLAHNLFLKFPKISKIDKWNINLLKK